MDESWKTEMVKEINRIGTIVLFPRAQKNGSISPPVEEERTSQVHQKDGLAAAQHVSTSRLNAIQSTTDRVEQWLARVIEPSYHSEEGK